AMLYVMFSFLSQYVYSQVRTAKGRMGILMKTDTTIYVMELKLDGTVEEALRQIDDKGYAIPYEADGRRIVKVGIRFSSEERTITEWRIEN
ncbi:MAG: PD-(D/E)XK nuclease domain-containing protein, partial [Bacteroidales bacterium]|nr:PD-(D/E)XK nuclease domain-containing protein [Bacteroidales bacterium]